MIMLTYAQAEERLANATPMPITGPRWIEGRRLMSGKFEVDVVDVIYPPHRHIPATKVNVLGLCTVFNPVLYLAVFNLN